MEKKQMQLKKVLLFKILFKIIFAKAIKLSLEVHLKIVEYVFLAMIPG